jgi:hypothetical protein
MVLIFWVITPLQSAIFTTGIVRRITDTSMVTTGTLDSVSSQVNSLNANFLNTAYGVSWLGQKLPAFTTKEYAVSPFQPEVFSQPSLSESWSSSAVAYSTHLTCTPAEITTQINLQYTFGNGKGCSVSNIGFGGASVFNASYLLLYIGYYNNAVLDYSLQNPNCSAEHSNNFLAVWVDTSSRTSFGVYSNFSAVFCEPTYFIQNITVQVNASDSSIMTSSFANDNNSTTRQLLSKDTFNITNFEYIIGTVVTPNAQRQDYPDITIIEQYPRLINYSLAWPTTNMVGFAVANFPKSIESLFHPSELQAAFESAHQILFSIAVATLTSPLASLDATIPRPGTIQDNLEAIILVRTIAIIVEVSFGLVVIVTGCLWYIARLRPSKMTADPASIRDIMTIIQNSGQILKKFQDDGTTTAALLEEDLRGHRFRLVASASAKGQTMNLEFVENTGEARFKKSPFSRLSNTNSAEKGFKAVRPIELSYIVGCALLLFIFLAIASLVLLWRLIEERNGMFLYSTNKI